MKLSFARLGLALLLATGVADLPVQAGAAAAEETKLAGI